MDSSGDAYVTGYTQSSNFPTTAGALQTTFGGGLVDAFVSKLNSSGSALLYSTYLGGSSDAVGQGIAVDSSGNAYVTGYTQSSNFPTTAGALQTTFGGLADAFVSKLNSSGSALVYSTYLGGGSTDFGFGIAVDSSGGAYVTGYTQSSNFPATAGALQTTFGGVFGGGPIDAFVSKLNSSGSALVYSTYLGGSSGDSGQGIAVDSSGDAYVTGYTQSSNFPTTAGAFQTSFGGVPDAFVSKLNSSGSALVYSTYLGGSSFDSGQGIAVDSSGDAYVTGYTSSSNFPATAGALQTTFGGGADAFVSKLNSGGSALVYSTYLGGSSFDFGFGIAVDSSGNAYVTGYTCSSNFPTTAGALQTTFGVGGAIDAFVAKFGTAPPTITITSPTNTTYEVNQPVPASYTCTNADNSVSTCAGPVPSGSNIDTSTLGSKSFTVNATDSHGNSSSATVNYTVVASSLTISLTVPANLTTYTLNESVPSAYTCSDPNEAVTACTGTAANGANIDTSSVGNKSFTVNATDAYNNSISQSVNYTVDYNIFPLYDSTHAVKSGGVIPIKLQLNDTAGIDVSSSSIVVHATGVVMVSTNASQTLQSPGSSSPDTDFRFDPTLGTTGGYIFNLSTQGYPTGTYLLNFTAGNDPTTHTAQFEVR